MFTLGRAPDFPHGRARVFQLSGGELGTEETIGIMKQMVYDSVKFPAVKQVAVMATAGCPPNSAACFSAKIFEYAKQTMRFVPDVHGVEEITAPWIHSERILRTGGSYGDCDDFSTLQAAWLSSLGVATRFTVIATPLNGGSFDHVRVEAKVAGRWVPLETTRRRARIGQKMGSTRERNFEV